MLLLWARPQFAPDLWYKHECLCHPRASNTAVSTSAKWCRCSPAVETVIHFALLHFFVCVCFVDFDTNEVLGHVS